MDAGVSAGFDFQSWAAEQGARVERALAAWVAEDAPAGLGEAKFFFEQDRKRTLESRVPALAKVVYHGKLGSQGERVERVRAIARSIGAQLGGATLAAGSWVIMFAIFGGAYGLAYFVRRLWQ